MQNVPKRLHRSTERAIAQELSEIRKLLTDARPSAPRHWYDRIYARVVLFAKYVGIPGIILAAIGPVEKLASDVVEHHNKNFIQTTYLDYSSYLLAQGAIERANNLLAILEDQKDFDTRLQYYKAKTLIAMAIQQGRNYTGAYDTAKILTTIQDNKDIFFPSFGGVEELLELKMALIDIDIAQQRYTEARSQLDAAADNKELQVSKLLDSNVQYRLGVLSVLQFRLGDAKQYLEAAIQGAIKTGQKPLEANATFNLAKSYQFGGKPDAALEIYGQSQKLYEAIADQFGLLRTYNNIAMIYFDRKEDEEARKFYNLEQNLARQLGDELGFARAQINIAVVEKRQRNFDLSIRLGLEALGIFKQQGNVLGISSAALLLSNDYSELENYPEAISYANQSLAAGLQLRDLRAVETACGSLANVYNTLPDYEEAIFTSLCAAAMIRYLNFQEIPSAKEDYGIFKAAIQRNRTSLSPDVYLRYLRSAEKRVADMLVQLNLEKVILASEVASLMSVNEP